MSNWVQKKETNTWRYLVDINLIMRVSRNISFKLDRLPSKLLKSKLKYCSEFWKLYEISVFCTAVTLQHYSILYQSAEISDGGCNRKEDTELGLPSDLGWTSYDSKPSLIFRMWQCLHWSHLLIPITLNKSCLESSSQFWMFFCWGWKNPTTKLHKLTAFPYNYR